MRTTTWNRKEFGEVLELLSKRAHLSQGQIAELAGRSRSQINRWTRSENQPNYEAVARLAGALAEQDPSLRPLTQQLMSAAGYGDKATAGNGSEAASPQRQAAASPRRGKTLGDVLVQRGLRKPEELSASDQIVDDPLIAELLEATEFDDAFKDRWLSVYSTMRREIFDEVKRQKKEPRAS